MNLLSLFITLTLAGLIFSRVEPLLALPVYGANALALKAGKIAFYVVAAVGLLWQTYILLGWSVFTLLLTEIFAARHVKTTAIIGLVGGGFVAFSLFPHLAAPWVWFIRPH